MRAMIVKILVLMLSACAPEHFHPYRLDISGFEDLVASFKAFGLAQGRIIEIDDLIIEFSDSIAAGGEDGLCVLNENQTPIILISRHFWAHSDSVHEEILLFHELGHCILGRRNHNNATTTINNGVEDISVPVSVMTYSNENFDVPGGIDYYTTRHDSFMKELFSRQ